MNPKTWQELLESAAHYDDVPPFIEKHYGHRAAREETLLSAYDRDVVWVASQHITSIHSPPPPSRRGFWQRVRDAIAGFRYGSNFGQPM